MRIREARPGERVAVRSIFDAAMLEVGALDESEVLVAGEAGRVLGAVAVDAEGPADNAVVEAVAVRPGRRGQGIGTALVAAATERWAPLVAEFDHGVRAFYEALGFEIRASDGDDDRLRGVHTGSP